MTKGFEYSKAQDRVVRAVAIEGGHGLLDQASVKSPSDEGFDSQT